MTKMNPFSTLEQVQADYLTYVQTFQRFQNPVIQDWIMERVRGTAVCSIKYPDTKGMKFLVVQPLDKHLKPVGPMQVAVDVVMAGPGDLCVMVRSREAALALREHNFVPVDLALALAEAACWVPI